MPAEIHKLDDNTELTFTEEYAVYFADGDFDFPELIKDEVLFISPNQKFANSFVDFANNLDYTDRKIKVSDIEFGDPAIEVAFKKIFGTRTYQFESDCPLFSYKMVANVNKHTKEIPENVEEASDGS